MPSKYHPWQAFLRGSVWRTTRWTDTLTHDRIPTGMLLRSTRTPTFTRIVLADEDGEEYAIHPDEALSLELVERSPTKTYIVKRRCHHPKEDLVVFQKIAPVLRHLEGNSQIVPFDVYDWKVSGENIIPDYWYKQRATLAAAPRAVEQLWWTIYRDFQPWVAVCHGALVEHHRRLTASQLHPIRPIEQLGFKPKGKFAEDSIGGVLRAYRGDPREILAYFFTEKSDAVAYRLATDCEMLTLL